MEIEKKKICETYIKAKSIDCFRCSTGKRRMQQPYWVCINEIMVFEFIGNHTDINQLKRQIGEQIIWVRESDFN